MDTQNPLSVGADVTPLPDWLTAGEPLAPTLSREAKSLSPLQFEAVFPRVMDMIADGCNMTDALDRLPIHINSGAFRRWVKKDPMRAQHLKDAEELRSEVWADKMMKHALGEYELEDVNRSKLAVDSYKWRIAADNRRKYGETKQIELGGQISITAALAAANDRLTRVIDAEVVEMIENKPEDHN